MMLGHNLGKDMIDTHLPFRKHVRKAYLSCQVQ